MEGERGYYNAVKMSSAKHRMAIKTNSIPLNDFTIYSELQGGEHSLSVLLEWILKMQFHCVLSEINTWEIGPRAREAYITCRFLYFQGVDVIGHRKSLRHPQARYQHTFLKWRQKGEKGSFLEQRY